VTAAVLLDEMSASNGPLCVMPGSHREGLIATPNGVLSRDALLALSRRYPIVALTAPRGSVVFFHSNLVHGSPNNISPFDRTIAYITYNSVDNQLRALEQPSPEHLASRDYTAIEALPDGPLLAC
jgi:ectoine hydroxylase